MVWVWVFVGMGMGTAKNTHGLPMQNTSCEHIAFKISLFQGGRVVVINLLCVAPTLLNKVELTVELWDKQDLKALCFAHCLEKQFDTNKVQLIVQCATLAAVCFLVRTLEILALS